MVPLIPQGLYYIHFCVWICAQELHKNHTTNLALLKVFIAYEKHHMIESKNHTVSPCLCWILILGCFSPPAVILLYLWVLMCCYILVLKEYGNTVFCIHGSQLWITHVFLDCISPKPSPPAFLGTAVQVHLGYLRLGIMALEHCSWDLYIETGKVTLYA